MTEACERNFTSAPQLGQETVCMRAAYPTSFFSSSALVLS
jgi:hypothetical protein